MLDRFIVFEGLDGAGTTTQSAELVRRIQANGSSCDHDCEPTGGILGTQIRRVLRGAESLHPCTLALLFAADRHEHLYAPDTGIIDRLEAGHTVVSDRYVYSSLAYQGVACGSEFVERANARYPHPQLLFFLEVPVSVCLERISGRGPVELYEKEHFLSKVAERYAEVIERAERDGVAVHRLDGTRPADSIAEEVWRIVAETPIVSM